AGVVYSRGSVTAVVEVPLSASLSVDTEPRGALITLDGKPVGRSPLTHKGVALGTHEVSAVLEGRETVKQAVTLTAAAQQEPVMLVLPQAKVAVVIPPPPPPPVNVQGPAPSKTSAVAGRA